MLIKQRGAQFFLVAALIIITIIFSFGAIYNAVQSPKSNTEDSQALANEIKYETVQLVNYGVYNNFSYDNIRTNIVNLTYFYSKEHPKYNITLIYGSTYDAQQGAITYADGSSTTPLTNVNVGQSITVTLNNISYSFNMTTGYYIYTVVQTEVNNERYIAEA